MDLRKQKEVMVDGVSLEVILNNHKHWLDKDVEGWENMRAHLDGADLSHIDDQLSMVSLSGAIIMNCDFSHSNLINTDFSEALISCCNFNNSVCIGARFMNSKIKYSNFKFADCRCSDFTGASIRTATAINVSFEDCRFNDSDIDQSDFNKCDFLNCKFKNTKTCNTVFRCCSLINVYTEDTSFFDCLFSISTIYREGSHGSIDVSSTEFLHSHIADSELTDMQGADIDYRIGKIIREPMIGYKKCKIRTNSAHNSVIVTLEIPKGAVVFSINGHKFRTNKVKVVAIDGADRAYSSRDNMSYYVGDEITVSNFDCRYNVDCSTGIHFFKTIGEANSYLI